MFDNALVGSKVVGKTVKSKMNSSLLYIKKISALATGKDMHAVQAADTHPNSTLVDHD